MVTIQLEDAVADALRAALGAPVTVPGTTPPPVVTPPALPPGISAVYTLVWDSTVGRKTTSGLVAGQTIVFKVKPLTAHPGVNASFYFACNALSNQDVIGRVAVLSDAPGKLTPLAPRGKITALEGRIYFTVGGAAIDKYGRVDTMTPNLDVGREYYFTVVTPPGYSGLCNINYGLTIPE